ncbi:hypothetical protein [Qipengyuania gaetbuli]|uniref:hypothetical protein n=1 Tax=Qipengyuania gaetbuli TaxID=266952 RepID=UPI001CFCAFA6|nr:hypothetical protein [Qipengyuania gaetbuli]
MEYEIGDDPQGRPSNRDEGARRDGGLVEDHIALRNQSSVRPEDYPREQREDQSLVQLGDE